MGQTGKRRLIVRKSMESLTEMIQFSVVWYLQQCESKEVVFNFQNSQNTQCGPRSSLLYYTTTTRVFLIRHPGTSWEALS